MEKNGKAEENTIMPWECRLSHLFKTLGEVITEELGDQAEKILKVALKDFVEKYGEEVGERVLSFQNTEFDRLP